MRPALQVVLDRWTPRKISPPPIRFYEFDDLSSMTQDSAATTAAAVNSPIGRILNKGTPNGLASAFISQATAGSRPTLTLDTGYLAGSFDGTDDFLSDVLTGLYAAGSCWVFVSGRFNPSAINHCLWAESNSGGTIQAYDCRSHSTVPDMASFIRNDSSATLHAVATDLAVNTWDNADRVIGFEDSGSALTASIDGVLQTPSAYTRSGAMSINRFALCARVTTSAGNFFRCYVNRFVVGTGSLSTSDRARLVSYMGGGIGRAL